jgi:transcription initiation factor TFIIIB Brf1 subunit/transcription initiation factor TFIIB
MICPKCKSTNIRTERSPIGEVKCNDCGFVLKERGSKEKLLPITEQDYPMPPVKEPIKNTVISTLSISVGFSAESATTAIREIGLIVGKYSISDEDAKQISTIIQDTLVVVREPLSRVEKIKNKLMPNYQQ